MEEKGHCKHGEFILNEGCPQCIAERRAKGITPAQDEMEDGLNQEGLTLASAEALAAETALATRPGADVEVISYYTEALKLQEYAKSRVIATPNDIKVATEDLSIIARLKKAMEEKRKEYTSPLQDQVKAINETYKMLMQPVEVADTTTRNKILAYNKEQEDRRREQERINAQKLEVAEAERRLNGKPSEPVELVEVSPDVPKTVSTDLGATSQRDNWKWEVVDFSLVPDDYKMINSGTLTPVVKASKGKITIPGIRIFNDPIISVTAR